MLPNFVEAWELYTVWRPKTEDLSLTNNSNNNNNNYYNIIVVGVTTFIEVLRNL
jgi:hypothetical protein